MLKIFAVNVQYIYILYALLDTHRLKLAVSMSFLEQKKKLTSPTATY